MKKNLPPITKEEYPILYAAEQRRKQRDQQIKRELHAYIDSLSPDLCLPLLQIVQNLPGIDSTEDERAE